MAHLNHKLPWNMLADRLTTIKEMKQFTPRYTDLCCKPDSQEHLVHFLNALSDVIVDFAVTERRKFRDSFPVRRSGQLFEFSVVEAALPFMENQDISSYSFHTTDLKAATQLESWIAHAGQKPKPDYDNPYNEVVSLLLISGEMDALLELAGHPDISLTALGKAGHNYQYSYLVTIQMAFKAYMCFNLLYCKPELWADGARQHFQARSFQVVMHELGSDIAGDLIYLSARQFLGWPHGILLYHMDIDPFDDLARLQDFLKKCFMLLVRHQVVETEAGRTVDWHGLYAGITSRPSEGCENMFTFGHRFQREDFRDRRVASTVG